MLAQGGHSHEVILLLVLDWQCFIVVIVIITAAAQLQHIKYNHHRRQATRTRHQPLKTKNGTLQCKSERHAADDDHFGNKLEHVAADAVICADKCCGTSSICAAGTVGRRNNAIVQVGHGREQDNGAVDHHWFQASVILIFKKKKVLQKK